MSERLNKSSEPAAALTNALNRPFDTLQDESCRVPVDTPGIETLKLYPSTPLGDFPPIHHVTVTRPIEPSFDYENPDLMTRLEFTSGDNAMRYHPLDGKIQEKNSLYPDRCLSSTRTQELLTFIDNLKERPGRLYLPQIPTEGQWSWTSHFRLHQPATREIVLSGIHAAVQAIRKDFAISPEDIPKMGLSGVLLGPNDAETVHEVIFASDPSNRYGLRESPDMDRHAFAIAEQHGWEETDTAVTSFDNTIRTIMGRDVLYSGTLAFGLEETRSLLPSDTLLHIEGGLLFSTRPTWEKPYREPAAIITANLNPNDPRVESDAVYEMAELAWRLGRQDRWVVESAEGAEVYKSNA